MKGIGLIRGNRKGFTLHNNCNYNFSNIKHYNYSPPFYSSQFFNHFSPISFQYKYQVQNYATSNIKKSIRKSNIIKRGVKRVAQEEQALPPPVVIELPYDTSKLTWKQRFKGFLYSNFLEWYSWHFHCVPYPPGHKYYGQDNFLLDLTKEDWKKIFRATMMDMKYLFIDIMHFRKVGTTDELERKKRLEKYEMKRAKKIAEKERKKRSFIKGIPFPPKKFKLIYFSNQTNRNLKNFSKLFYENFMIGFKEGRKEQQEKWEIFKKVPIEDHVRNHLQDFLAEHFSSQFKYSKPKRRKYSR